ncbi:hypothetical protein XENOCAPTIV_012022 [Xenoophorus captivus]|uniref:Secreted protein n=1 Tax=Xenoophorus captivus TaxID=1517983 RepID=A0ABV0SFR1_9TELE
MFLISCIIQHVETALISFFSSFTFLGDESFSAAEFRLSASSCQQKTGGLGTAGKGTQTEATNCETDYGSLSKLLPLLQICIKHWQLVAVTVDLHVRKHHTPLHCFTVPRAEMFECLV